MPRSARRIPKLRHHKATDRAVVRIEGQDYYLGPWGPDAQQRYHVAMAEWLATGRNPFLTTEGMTVEELRRAYLHFAEGYYLKRGKQTQEVYAIRHATDPLIELYGKKKVADFGPVALKVVREQMVESGLARVTVNDEIGRLKRMFRWGTENEFVPAGIFQALDAVAGLRKGRTRAPETEPVRPVELGQIEDMIDQVAPPVAAMIWLQYWTGMRPGEVVLIRMKDLDRTGKVWIYTPEYHKTEHMDRERSIYIGPKAQDVLRPWLKMDPDSYLFDPREAEAERYRDMRARRKTRVQPSQMNRRKTKPKVKPRRHYTTDTYRRAITRGCELAGIASWAPNQLRHSAATRLRRERGIEAARVVLGHSSATVTEIYAEIDRSAASRVMGELG